MFWHPTEFGYGIAGHTPLDFPDADVVAARVLRLMSTVKNSMKRREALFPAVAISNGSMGTDCAATSLALDIAAVPPVFPEHRFDQSLRASERC